MPCCSPRPLAEGRTSSRVAEFHCDFLHLVVSQFLLEIEDDGEWIAAVFGRRKYVGDVSNGMVVLAADVAAPRSRCCDNTFLRARIMR